MILVGDYEGYSDINPSLYDTIRKEANTKIVGEGSRTDWKYFLYNRTILLDWIENILPAASCDVIGQEHSTLNYYNSLGENYRVSAGGRGGFNPYYFDIVTCWGIHYNKGEGIVKHNHFPYTFGFTYFVKAGENCSPFVVDGEEIETVEGRLVLFPGYIDHWANPGEGERTVIAGNVLYSDRGSL
tara:strand:+ start:16 stop:570 length:555 start_codon:yes stop_codon:yes gene_type:complete